MKKLGLLLTAILCLSVFSVPGSKASMGGGCSSPATTVTTTPDPSGSPESDGTGYTFWATNHNFGGRNNCTRQVIIYWGDKHDRSTWSSIVIDPGQSFNTNWALLDGGKTGFASGPLDSPRPCAAPVANYEVRSNGVNDIWRVACLS